jgi:hypothetical protein
MALREALLLAAIEGTGSGMGALLGDDSSTETLPHVLQQFPIDKV